jgi:hypothetical protein
LRRRPSRRHNPARIWRDDRQRPFLRRARRHHGATAGRTAGKPNDGPRAGRADPLAATARALSRGERERAEPRSRLAAGPSHRSRDRSRLRNRRRGPPGGRERSRAFAGDKSFPAASTIKLAILVSLVREVEAGRLDLERPYPIEPHAASAAAACSPGCVPVSPCPWPTSPT